MADEMNQAHIRDLKPAENLPVLAAPIGVSSGFELQVATNAAQSKAAVEARYVMALRQPRTWDVVRQKIIAECRRPGFANNKSVYYVKPIGDGAEGLGIRFAEAAIRCATNILIESAMMYEDPEKEIHRVTVTDLESNSTYWLDVRVSKYIERRKVEEGQQVFSVRKNSQGYKVYTVLGTEDDLLNKRGAAISKAIRTLTLRLIPGDIQDEAEAVIKEIRLAKATKDPTAERKAIADGFFDVGVPADELIDFLGHSLDTCSPPELVKLRGICGAIKDGEASWAQVVENGWELAPVRSRKPKDETKEPKVDTKGAAAGTKGAKGETNPPADDTATVAEKGKLQATTDATVVPATGQTVATPEGDRGPPAGDLLGGAPAEPRKPRPARKRTGSIE